MIRTFSILLLILSVFGIQPILAQNHGAYGNRQGGGPRPVGTIEGIVNDDDGVPVEYATVSLFRMRDSSLSTGAITDAAGKYKFEAKAGRYFMKIEFIAFTPKILTNIKVHPDNLEVDLKTVSIARKTSDLSEVEITAERSQVEVGLDKKVFNVAKDLSNIGGTASEVLENIPSVIVDVDGNISLRGSENVRILIDGKPSGLMGISPAKALEQIPANTIESIEIVTNPSARYDAEGLAGIINIILKKDRAKGFNGMINVTTGYPHRHNANLSFNYKLDKVNFFGTVGARFRESPGSVIYHRETTTNDTLTTIDQNGAFTRGGLSYNIRLGADYSIDKNNTLTFSGSYSPSTGENERSTDYQTLDYDNVLRDQWTRSTVNYDVETSMDLNAGYLKRFKKKGRKLNIDFRYSAGEEDGNMDMLEEYDILDYVADLSIPLEQRTNDFKTQSDLTIQADYVHPLSKGSKMEFGYKTGIQNKNLNYIVEELNDSSDVWSNLTNVSNHFIYDEEVHAGYGIYSNKIKKFSYQVGLRAEQTYVTSTLKQTDEVYDKEYLNLFPSVHLSQDLAKDNKLQVSFSRRIRRPRSRSLNPFNSYADPWNLWIGNPNLNPELTSSYEIGHMKYWEKSFLGTTLYHRHTDSVISRIRTIDSLGVSTTLPRNLSTKDDFGVEVTFSKEFTKWWKVNGSLNYFRSILDGGNLDAEYGADAFSYTGRLNSTMTFWKNVQFQTMFNYRGPRQTVQGERKAMYFIDFGVKKDILKKRGTLNLKVSDVMNTRQFVMETYGDNFFIETKYRHSSRVVFLSFSYKINRYKPKRRGGGSYDMENMGM